MFDVATSAAMISNTWPAILGEKNFPKALADLFAVYSEINYVEEPQPVFDPAKVTTKTVNDDLLNLAEAMSVTAQFKEARAYAKRSVGGAIIRTADSLIGTAIETLEGKFTANARAFTEAVAGLPEQTDPVALVAAGPSVLAQFQSAQASAREIEGIQSFLESLSMLPSQAGFPAGDFLTVMDCETRKQLRACENASGGGGDLNRVYVAGVKAGVGFKIRTPRQAAALREELNSQPEDRAPFRFAQIGTGELL